MKRAYAVLGTAVFLFVGPGIVAGLVPWMISRWHLAPPMLGLLPLRAVGALLILAGLAAVLDSFARFALRGLGTPVPVLPTQHLVVSGLYRYVRNPMYVAVLSTIVGQALFLGNEQVLVYAAALALGFHAFVVAYEEPTLRRTQGKAYEAYCRSVRRWLPRLRPWEGGQSRS